VKRNIKLQSIEPGEETRYPLDLNQRMLPVSSSFIGMLSAQKLASRRPENDNPENSPKIRVPVQ
jgi:hypothetical protein